MPLDVFPVQFDRESPSDLEDFVDDVILWAETRACEGRVGCESGFDSEDESLVVSGDADPWFGSELGRRRKVMELEVREESFDEDEEGELADAL